VCAGHCGTFYVSVVCVGKCCLSFFSLFFLYARIDRSLSFHLMRYLILFVIDVLSMFTIVLLLSYFIFTCCRCVPLLRNH
jgi:hypothetical protein